MRNRAVGGRRHKPELGGVCNMSSSQVIRSESGKAISWAILLCAAVAGAYLNGGKEYLEQHLPPFYNMMVLMGLGFVCIASLGCGLHLLVLGGQSDRELRRTMREQNDALLQLVRESDALIRGMETDLGRCSLKLSARGLDCLAMARRIVRALDRRTSEIQELLSSDNGIDLIDAEELSRKKLIIGESAMDSLISSDPVPPLAPEEWVPSLKRIFGEIENERKKTA